MARRLQPVGRDYSMLWCFGPPICSELWHGQLEEPDPQVYACSLPNKRGHSRPCQMECLYVLLPWWKTTVLVFLVSLLCGTVGKRKMYMSALQGAQCIHHWSFTRRRCSGSATRFKHRWLPTPMFVWWWWRGTAAMLNIWNCLPHWPKLLTVELSASIFFLTCWNLHRFDGQIGRKVNGWQSGEEFTQTRLTL